MPLDGDDQVDGGVGEETEEEEEIDLWAGLSMVQRIDKTGRNQKDIGKSNHADNLEEGGDKEKVGEEQGEEHGDVAPGLPPLAERHLRLWTVKTSSFFFILPNQATAEEKEDEEDKEDLAKLFADPEHPVFLQFCGFVLKKHMCISFILFFISRRQQTTSTVIYI